jgi:hypothetical protein
VHVFHVCGTGIGAGAGIDRYRPRWRAAAVGGRPCHSVNLSRDSEQEYFVDGLTESLTTELSRIAGSFVIARNTAFAYKGKDTRCEAGRARARRCATCWRAACRAAGSRVRLNVQLIDAETGAHLWAGPLSMVSATTLFRSAGRDRVRLSRALNVELVAAEAGRAERCEWRIRIRPTSPYAVAR